MNIARWSFLISSAACLFSLVRRQGYIVCIFIFLSSYAVKIRQKPCKIPISMFHLRPYHDSWGCMNSLSEVSPDPEGGLATCIHFSLLERTETKRAPPSYSPHVWHRPSECLTESAQFLTLLSIAGKALGYGAIEWQMEQRAGAFWVLLCPGCCWGGRGWGWDLSEAANTQEEPAGDP